MTAPKKHGGPRPGSGRKPTGKRRTLRADVALSEEEAARVQATGSGPLASVLRERAMERVEQIETDKEKP